VLSGHRRLACARALGLVEVPCEVRDLRGRAARRLAVLEYNRQRRKTFSQLMREADALETLYAVEARKRRWTNLRQFREDAADRRDSDNRTGRTDTRIARALGLGGKDLYRQARAVWQSPGPATPAPGAASPNLTRDEVRPRGLQRPAPPRPLQCGLSTHPYDVWPFKHDRASASPPRFDPPAVVAHTLHYYTAQAP